MNEKGSNKNIKEGKSKREWVKTAAIVFLSVLLVLTFFSNTIMNYSLPEVATQYVESSTITAKIRGTGMVESGDPYNVRLKTTGDTNATGAYEVESIEVRKGDNVQKGDVLCYLSGGGSVAAEAKQKEMDDFISRLEVNIIKGLNSSTVLTHIRNGNVASLSTYQAQVDAKKNEIQNLKDELTNAKNELSDAEDRLASWSESGNNQIDSSKEKKKLDEAQAAYDAVADVVDAAKEDISKWEAEIKENNKLIQDYVSGKVMVNENGETVPVVSQAQYDAAIQNNTILNNLIDSKKKELTTEEAKLPDLKKALDKAKKAYNNKLSGKKSDVEDARDNWKKEVEKYQERVDQAETDLEQMRSDFEIEQEWDKLRDELADLQGESVDGVVRAPISGSIISVEVKSGEETPTNNILFTMQPEGKGYTMQFTVTNEQAKRLSVGDEAELVNSWRYDDVNVVLSSIKPDPQNPSQNKLLTFDVTGDVTDGQTLNVSVGQRSSTYDLTVPNSAIREDNNGKFILTVETKSTPLSNRYIATRVDVEVLASDDNRSAINAPLYGYEYVITTSTAPVEAGKQVRLANNN